MRAAVEAADGYGRYGLQIARLREPAARTRAGFSDALGEGSWRNKNPQIIRFRSQVRKRGSPWLPADPVLGPASTGLSLFARRSRGLDMRARHEIAELKDAEVNPPLRQRCRNSAKLGHSMEASTTLLTVRNRRISLGTPALADGPTCTGRPHPGCLGARIQRLRWACMRGTPNGRKATMAAASARKAPHDQLNPAGLSKKPRTTRARLIPVSRTRS